MDSPIKLPVVFWLTRPSPFSIRCFEFVLQFRTIDFVFLVSSSIIVKMGCSAARAIMVQWWTFHYNVASIRGVNSILFYLLLLSTDLQFVVTIYLQLTKSHSYLCRFLFMFWTLNVWKNSVICWVFTLVYLQSVWLRLLTITYCLILMPQTVLFRDKAINYFLIS